MVSAYWPQPSTPSMVTTPLRLAPGTSGVATPSHLLDPHGAHESPEFWTHISSRFGVTIQVPAGTVGFQGLPVMASRSAVRTLMPCLRAVEM
jgi:hypothetical protein